MVTQHFVVGDVHLQGMRTATTPFYLSNRHGYYVGSIGGQATAYGAEHLVGRMGGLWIHPLRVMHACEIQDAAHPIDHAITCTVHDTAIIQHYQHAALQITVQTSMPAELAGVVCDVTISNPTAEPWVGALELVVQLTMHGCWFGGQSEQSPQLIHQGSTVAVTAGEAGLTGWSVLGCGEQYTWQSHTAGVSLPLATTVAAGATLHLRWWLATSHTSATQAHQVAAALAHWMPSPADQAHPSAPVAVIASQHPRLGEDWQIACHNMRHLIAEYPDIPPYMLAGIPEYPQLFGCDTTYSIVGMMAAGHADIAKSALLALAQYAQRTCGRVPHEVTTNGRVYHPGNAQETPQFAVACWEYVMWSGDLAFAAHVYPLCVEGMAHMQGVLAGHHWPYGDGMVERHGMGPFKLDSVAYLYQAVQAMHQLATALQYADDAQRWQRYATQLQTRFEADWWMPEQGLYADSLQRDGRPQLDEHWTAVVPVYTQLANMDRQKAVYTRLRRDFVNEWGLVHTRHREEHVWTLPTGLLALAAFQQHDADYGYTLLQNIAETARTGSLGLMKELIPEGMCFVQLWSTALYMQGIIAGMCGVQPRAHAHELTLTPGVPAHLGVVEVQGISFGAHCVDLAVHAHGMQITHRSGSQSLQVRVPHLATTVYVLPVGEQLELTWTS